MGTVVHEGSDGVEVALSGQAALGDDDHPGAEAFDLLEDVAGDHHGPSLFTERREQRDHAQTLPRVESVERFVENDQLRPMDDCGGDLHPLAHALGVHPQWTGIGRVELDFGQRVVGRGCGAFQPAERSHGSYEVVGGDRFEDAVLLRNEPDVTVQLRFTPGRVPENGDRTL